MKLSFGQICSSQNPRENTGLALKIQVFLFKFFSFAFYNIHFWFKISKICPKTSHFSQISHSRGNTRDDFLFIYLFIYLLNYNTMVIGRHLGTLTCEEKMK